MKIINKVAAAISVVLLFSCTKVLDLKPTDKIDGKAMFSDPAGVRLYMANLYSELPIEDFNFMRGGFNDWTGETMVTGMFTDEAQHSEYNDFLNTSNIPWWDQGYKLIRDVNVFSEVIPTLDIPSDQRKAMIGESAFIKAYSYFALAKRYGGVPLIDSLQEYNGDADALKVPRSTEKETWDFVLKQCDIAIDNLPSSWAGGERRATTWVAYALKARAALFAASIAKYGYRANMSGNAVVDKLVGIEDQYANEYYKAAIDAAAAIMTNGPFSLHKPNPANPVEASENYREIFEDPSVAPEECIFIKGYAKVDFGHNYGIYFGPAQSANGWFYPGRMDPALELIDEYENYNNPGERAPIITSDDPDDINNYSGFNSNKHYRHFAEPADIFEGKDARMWGTVILPGTLWKNTKIVIQAGFIKPDGTPEILSGNPYLHSDGNTYYVFGGKDNTQYSGFDPDGGDYTRTGISFKKFLDQRTPVLFGYSKGITDYIDFRYAEILLIYAEAVVESGYSAGDAVSIATKALNDIRKRAAFTTDIPLTVENVQRERRIELAFENQRFWDLIRRREFHTLYDNKMMHALLPVVDLRTNPVSYIFIRSEVPRQIKHVFEIKQYYRPIPGTGTNGAIQNPQY